MTDPLKLPAQPQRVGTGPIQFGDDWPGVFIRGDNAAHYAMHLRTALQALPKGDFVTRSILIGLYSDLVGCVVGSAADLFEKLDTDGLIEP